MIALLFFIAALVLFVLASLNIPMGRVSPTNAGLACLAAAFIASRVLP